MKPTYVSTVRSLLEYPREQEWFEFKANWFEPKALGEYLSALANAAAFHGQSHGYLVWGVNDATHAVVGTKFDPAMEIKGEPLKHFLARQLTPDTAFAFHDVRLEGKRIVLLKIAAARNVPTAFDGVRYFRIGSSKVALGKFPEREAELFQTLRHGPPTLSNTPAERQDLAFSKLIVYYAAKGITLNKQTFKRNLGLLMPDGKYNLLAQLLSDDCGIAIRFAMFAGTDKASTMYSVREIGRTCLLYALDKALELGELLNVPQADERHRVVERKDVPLFNAAAYREAVVNAFVHNRWTDFNSPMFCAYSDRLEILSHGALPPGQTLQGFFEGVSVPVNRELSDVFLQLHLSERTGRGVPKIVGAYDTGIYRFGENAITVILPFSKIHHNAAVRAASDGKTPQVEDKHPKSGKTSQVAGNAPSRGEHPKSRGTPQVVGNTPSRGEHPKSRGTPQVAGKRPKSLRNAPSRG
ncbi:MAG: putative DNA binding domain-containing protein, partial [Planctomycetes bacterium]|nr:putative DNA binding domain-containing protein [Planctomycetota bacterium]